MRRSRRADTPRDTPGNVYRAAANAALSEDEGSDQSPWTKNQSGPRQNSLTSGFTHETHHDYCMNPRMAILRQISSCPACWRVHPLVWFVMMTTCLDLAAEPLSVLIAGHEERAEVREERRGAGGHTCQGLPYLGGSVRARDPFTLAALPRPQLTCHHAHRPRDAHWVCH